MKLRKKENRILKTIVIIALFVAIFMLLVLLIFSIYVDRKIEKHIDETLFTVVGAESQTVLYYYDGSEDSGKRDAVPMTEEALYGGYRCQYVSYESIPDNLKNAFVSIEDKRFFSHKGVDWKRTLSAAVNYFLKFDDSYGGSTITQQLIKNVTDEDDYSFQRKIQEIFWALDLETKMDKQEILGLYLNIINLSQGCYGVQAASNYYFSKHVSQLTLNECACIAAITNSPTYYDPIRNPEHNQDRKNVILQQMYDQGYITDEELRENLGRDVELNINQEISASSVQSWYADMVIEDVITDLMEDKGYSRPMANLVLYTGGLQIYTAMDAEIQAVLEDYYSKTSNFYSSANGETPQSSMIIIDPQNGDILGVVGAIGTKNANRIQNFATQTLRPAGSVIKPLSVYAPAIDQNLITWSSVYDDVPVNFGKYNLDPEKGTIVEPVAWPKNATGEYRGLTNINYAIEHSVNTVIVRVLEKLGVEQSFNFLYDQLHLQSLIRSGYTQDGVYITDQDVAALALGQMNYGVTVKEVTAAYSIFTNHGIYNTPRSYYKVTDSKGSILLDCAYEGEAVIGEESAAVMSLMLENVVKSGTAKDITLKDTVDCAGKTGTTQNNYDRWYIGYTPYLIGGVWYGYEYPKAMSGSNQCIKIWDDVMKILHKKILAEEQAAGTAKKSLGGEEYLIEREYCADSGLLVTPACLRDPRGDRTEKGYFIEGTEPTEYCTCHVPVAYDTVHGGVAFSGGCPNESVEYVGMICVERSFPIQIYVTDAQYVWRNIGTEILPETSPSLPFFNNLLKKNEFCGISKVQYQYNRYCRVHFNYFDWKEEKENSA